MNRREFLKTSAGAAALSIAPGCASAAPKRLEVIDTHTHFYDPTRPQGVPWPSRDDKVLYRPVYPKDYRAIPTPQPVRGTVVVEASPWIEDNQWILDLAAKDPFIVGFIGNLPVGKDEFGGHLKRFAANTLFRGLRIGARPLDDANVRDLKMLADRDLSLDLLGGKEILTFADQLADKLPRLRIVVDHLASLRIDGKTPPAEWTQSMQALARRKNVYCKISGLVESAPGSPRDPAFYKPVLDFMRHTFGAERLMYASNWPVSERFAPLEVVQSIVHDYFESNSPRDLKQVFADTGRAAYRLA